MRPKVSIIIVFYSGAENLYQCLSSIKESRPETPYEVIVVDNSEREEIKIKIAREFSWVKYIESENRGYGAGNNLGARYARGEYLFILNPDTVLFKGSLDTLVNFLEKRKNVAIVAPNLLAENGKIFPQMGSKMLTPIRGIVGHSFLNKLFPDNPISREYWLKNIPLNKLREVDAVPGSAFLIRKDVFEKVGAFDENMFLFFEESDLGKRVREAGYKIFINPKAEVKHRWTLPGQSSARIKRYFEESRFYYFKKHYGVWWALIVEAFVKFSKWQAALILILFLAAFLRLWRIGTLMHFIGDFGWFYLSARDFLLSGKIPLVGIPSSVPVLRQGAIWTWLLASALWVGNFNPVSGGILTGVLGTIAVWGIYKVTSGWFDKRGGLIAAILAASCPFIVTHDRMPYHTVPIFPITLLVAWSANRVAKGEVKHFFFLGFWLAILFQFELAGFILLPIVFLALLWQKVKIVKKEIFKFCLGGFFGLAPLIVWDIQQGTYLQTVGFGFWVIRKVVRGFLAVFSGGRSLATFSPAGSFLADFIFPLFSGFAIALFALGLVVFLISSMSNIKKQAFSKKFIFVWFFVGVVGFFLQGVFSEAYMPTIFFPTLLILSLFFDWLMTKTRYFGWAILILLTGVNIISMMRGFLNSAKVSPTFSQRLEVANFIIKDAQGKKYELTYLGPGHMYQSGDNHYRYLLWWQGNEPVVKAALRYTIIDPPYMTRVFFERSQKFGDIKVGVNER